MAAARPAVRSPRKYPARASRQEISLLRDVPRTATVVSSGAVHATPSAREDFIDAVSGSPSSRRAADARIDTRLGSFRAGLATV